MSSTQQFINGGIVRYSSTLVALCFTLGYAQSAGAKAWRICLEQARVAPTKLDGFAWDGLSRERQVSPQEAMGFGAAIATGAPPLALVAKGSSLISKLTAAPEVRVILRAGDRVAFTSDFTHDTYTPTWSPSDGACTNLTDDEAHKMLRIVVQDVDQSAHDLIAKVVLPKGIPDSAFTQGLWTIRAKAALGILEMTVVEADVAAPAKPKLKRGKATIPASRTWPVSIVVDAAPVTLDLKWKGAGRSIGLRGAANDKLIGFTLTSPSGKLLERKGKHTSGAVRQVLRKPGTYTATFSNAGIIRSSARQVTYSYELKPLK